MVSEVRLRLLFLPFSNGSGATNLLFSTKGSVAAGSRCRGGLLEMCAAESRGGGDAADGVLPTSSPSGVTSLCSMSRVEVLEGVDAIVEYFKYKNVFQSDKMMISEYETIISSK